MPVVTTLNRKLARDLWHLRGQALAIGLVIAAAVATLVLSLGTQWSLEETRQAYYERNRFAHVFARARRAPEHLVERIRAIPGVARAETRIVDHVLLDMPGIAEPVRGAIVSLPERDEPVLNLVVMRAGRALRPGHADEVLVHEAFAEAHRLRPGDTVTVTMNGRRRRLDVVGVALSPEFVYAIGPGDLVPDNRRYGVIWMGREALEAAYDLKGAFNEVSLQLHRGATEAAVTAALDDLIDRYGGAGAYGRTDHVSDSFINSEIDQLRTLTRIVPPIFLTVAMFLLNVVINRLIQTEREQIGLLKAFGYTDRAVGWHYTKFAMAVAAIGIAIGIAAGVWMGRAMTELYTEYFRFPVLHYQLSLEICALAAAASMLAACGGGAFAVRKAVRLPPAVAMAPPPPSVYRAGALERSGLLRGLTPVGYMVLRHITRWPIRSLVTTTGIALAIGLLVSTLQFLDSIDEMLDAFFFGTQRQDLTIRFTETRNDSIAHELARLPGVLRAELRRAVPVRLSFGHLSRRAALLGLDRDADLNRQIDVSGRPIVLPPEGLVLSDRLAQNLGARAGDAVMIEVLEGRRERLLAPVSHIVSEYVGTVAYMSRPALNRLMREGPVADGAHLMIDPAQRAELFRALQDAPAVLGIAVQSAALATFREMINQNVVTMIAFYVTFASVIAVGVVYNSARISLAERARELATLRVLGYRKREVALILVGELAVLTVLAMPLGCLIGYALSALMIALFSTDLYRMPFALEASTYGYAIVVVLAAAGFTTISVARRVGAFDLVAVLKARE
jgi:putative ABC transport system permease protein